MRIIVAGCGKIGATVIKSLLSEGHDIVVIDNNPATVQNITNIYDVFGVCGSCSDYDTLKEAEIEKAHLFTALTGSDEVNMLSCFIARKMGAHHSVARIRNPEYNDNALSFLKQNLNLSMSVNPDRLAAKEVFNMLKMPGAANIEAFSRRNFEMIELVVRKDSPFSGISLSDMRKKYPFNCLICAVLRGENVYIPDGNFVLCEGDRIGVTALFGELQKLFREVGLAAKSAKNVMIAGASKTSYYLAKMLISSGTNVKIIDQDRQRCADFIEKFPSATVICGDCADKELLFEEGLCSIDAFVALSGIDEQNILVSYSARDAGVKKVITKVSKQEFYDIASSMGIESLVTQQKVVSDIFVRYARALENSMGSAIENLYKLMGNKAEAMEFKVQDDFKYCNIPLRDLKLKRNVLVAGIIRGRKIIIPTGTDVIQSSDRVVVISTVEHKMNNLSDIIM